MDRRSTLGLPAIVGLGLPALVSIAAAQQKAIKEQIVGTWTFVSALDVHPTGKRQIVGAPTERHFHF
jgi:hypothetical protein